jgi:hypothetical protein
MCIVHTVKYAGCEHIHSYAKLVHADAAYCAHQRVLHDGTSTEQHKCPVCVKEDLKLAHVVGESLGTNRWHSDEANCRQQRKQTEALASQTTCIESPVMEVLENHFAEPTIIHEEFGRV